MPKTLHIDIETFSSVPIQTSGMYKYFESVDFEILLVAYAFDNEEVKIVDLTQGELLPPEFLAALQDPKIAKHAHNAAFERKAFEAIGFKTPANQWFCSSVKSAFCGFPLSLEKVSEALKLEKKGKLTTGKALIRYFCIPCKPTISNGKRCRNMPKHDLQKWQEFKKYCINDVVAEREITRILERYKIPKFERQNYILDQKINDRGILIDTKLAKNAFDIDVLQSEITEKELKSLTGLENPNSPTQLKKWLGNAIGEDIQSLAKDEIPLLFEKTASDTVKKVLDLRLKSSKTSIKKYTAMLNCVCKDNRSHGLFQFYGANRTGRWAGRLIQLQNLPRNYLKDLELAREIVLRGDHDLLNLLYGDVSDVLSQLIRTAFIAKPNHTFAVADFSAIEARIIAWLAGEQWRLDVFNSHGKIYEASASMMFKVPIEQITKSSDLRYKGKIAELALGYGGSSGALEKMGASKMGLSKIEVENIVKKWRESNKNITNLWKKVDFYARAAVQKKRKFVLHDFENIAFDYDGNALSIALPSGRKLYYQSPKIKKGRFGQESLHYMGVNPTTKKWEYIETYGGKLVENIVQAIARDILADAMQRINNKGFKIVMHVHDEVNCEVPEKCCQKSLDMLCSTMGEPIEWAKGLPLNADGYVTFFYKKD